MCLITLLLPLMKRNIVFSAVISLVLTGAQVLAQKVVVKPIEQSGIDSIPLGDIKVAVNAYCYKPSSNVIFIHVHEDEKTAKTAAMEFLDSVQYGCFVTLNHGKGRNIEYGIQDKKYKIDPNRMFTEPGAKASLTSLSAFSQYALNPVLRMANKFVLKYIHPYNVIVALHNNTNNGGLTIQSYAKGGAYEKEAADVFINPAEDPDDFLYTTVQSTFEYFVAKGFNVVLQKNYEYTDDGSLSIYAGAQLGKDYINIEVEHGKPVQQKKMLQAVLEYIADVYGETPGISE